MFKIEPWFEGKRVVIIGGGTSLTPKQIHIIAKARLALNSDIRVICVNDAIYLAWWADWLHACDMKWWNWHAQQVSGFKGIRTTLDPAVPKEWANLLQNAGKPGFDPDPSRCTTGANGGYQAMHCAIHAGAKEITLVGIDIDQSGHWFGSHPTDVKVNRLDVMLPWFKGLVPVLKERGIKVFNASPISKIDCWPKVDLEQHLK